MLHSWNGARRRTPETSKCGSRLDQHSVLAFHVGLVTIRSDEQLFGLCELELFTMFPTHKDKFLICALLQLLTFRLFPESLLASKVELMLALLVRLAGSKPFECFIGSIQFVLDFVDVLRPLVLEIRYLRLIFLLGIPGSLVAVVTLLLGYLHFLHLLHIPTGRSWELANRL
jgi:hypothetical protein